MRFHLKSKILPVLILLAGCSSYDTLTIEKRIKIDRQDGYEIIFDYGKSGSEVKKPADRTFHLYKTERKFSGKSIPGPAGNIITRGIAEAIQENYREAEFLFLESEKLVSDGSAQNNLAIVYEASGRYDEAFSMYSKALLISPDEKVFRSNFHLFLNQNYNEGKEPVKKTRR